MSDSTANLRRTIASAGELRSVVRTMKAVAASSVGQYEKSVRALADYYRTVELGLSACFRQTIVSASAAGGPGPDTERLGAIVFGSDQGLVGRFNDVIADYACAALAALPGTPQVWAVGERVHTRLQNAGLPMVGLFALPRSVDAIAELVGRLQIESETHRTQQRYTRVYLFHNRPKTAGQYEPVSQRLLPLDEKWQQGVSNVRWPSPRLPELLGSETGTLRALVREYLFISLFRACAESLASENASRLAAMGRADKNIGDLLESLQGRFHRLRQQGIDEELFDVVAGYDALRDEDPPTSPRNRT